MVFHGFWLVSIVLLVETTTKLYPGPTIQSRPCRLWPSEDDDGNDDDWDEDSHFYGGWFVSWEGGIFSLLKIPPLAY